VRGAEARSAQISRPEGVARSFHVSLYKVEPVEAVIACNLFAKDDWRRALADEVVECGPKMPLVSKPFSFACRAERLTGAASCPHGPVVVPSGKSQAIGPDADSGEEMALGVAAEVGGLEVSDVIFDHVSRCDGVSLDEFAQPRGRERVDLVVEDGGQTVEVGHDVLSPAIAPITSA
jgi:hypothetical protein